MRHARFRLALGSMVLPAMILASMSAGAAETKTTGATSVIDAAAETTPAPATADEAKPDKTKPGRLRFRSADGTCACTCAKGGMSEADIRRVEELRASARN